MFLDDQIVEYIESNITSSNGKEIAEHLIKMCCDKIIRDVTGCENNSQMIANQVKRTYNYWDSAAEILRKKGTPYLKAGAFRDHYLNNAGEFKNTLIRLGV